MNSDIITYKDLIDLTLRIIKSKCANVTGSNQTISKFFKNNTTGTLTNINYKQKLWNSERTSNFNITYTISDSICDNVSQDRIKTDLTNYLKTHGLSNNEDKIITLKDILNYYYIIASFISSKLVCVVSQFSNQSYIVYDASTSVSSVSSNMISDSNLTDTSIKTIYNNILSCLNKTTNSHLIHTVLSFNSSIC